jgi:CheY-like chemotaxis protein
LRDQPSATAEPFELPEPELGAAGAEVPVGAEAPPVFVTSVVGFEPPLPAGGFAGAPVWLGPEAVVAMVTVPAAAWELLTGGLLPGTLTATEVAAPEFAAVDCAAVGATVEPDAGAAAETGTPQAPTGLLPGRASKTTPTPPMVSGTRLAMLQDEEDGFRSPMFGHLSMPLSPASQLLMTLVRTSTSQPATYIL